MNTPGWVMAVMLTLCTLAPSSAQDIGNGLAWVYTSGRAVATVVVPAGYHPVTPAQRGEVDFVPEGEDVPAWKHIITFMAFALAAPSSDPQGTLAGMKDHMLTTFLAGCDMQQLEPNATTYYGFASEDGFASLSWMQSCRMLKSGPSKGGPETDYFKLMMVDRLVVVIMGAVRDLPSDANETFWRAQLANAFSHLRPAA